MKKFFSGMITGLALGGLMVTGAAAVGKIDVNTINLFLNNHRALTQGETITAANGCEVPSSICYTDEQGGGTVYVPLRYLFETIGAPVYWDSEDNSVDVSVTGDYALNLKSTEFPEVLRFDSFERVETRQPSGSEKMLVETTACAGKNAAFEQYLAPKEQDGAYITFTVKNYDAAPLQISLGIAEPVENGSKAVTSVRLNAGETGTYTIRITDFSTLDTRSVYFRAGEPEDVNRAVNFDVSIVQFDA